MRSYYPETFSFA